jgi:hypothetical protein
MPTRHSFISNLTCLLPLLAGGGAECRTYATLNTQVSGWKLSPNNQFVFKKGIL